MAKIKMQKSTADHKLTKAANVILKRGRKPLTDAEREPDARFIRVAGMRLAKILKLSKGLRACANTLVYEYTEEQVDRIFTLIRNSIDRTENAFRIPAVNGARKPLVRLENPLESVKRSK